MLYADRRQAGRELASRVAAQVRGEPLVLALPRGGVPVAYEVALALKAPLDVYIVRKLGVPGHEELGMGALAEDGTRLLNQAIIEDLGVPMSVVQAVTAAQKKEIRRRERAYRQGAPAAEVAGRCVVLVDDGLATGYTMRAAAEALRRRRPSRLIAAAPVGAEEACAEMEKLCDVVVIPQRPSPFMAVGTWYDDFTQTTDDEVTQLLAASREQRRVPQG